PWGKPKSLVSGAIRAKTGIESAVSFEPCNGKVVLTEIATVGSAGHDDFTVTLYGKRVALVAVAAKSGRGVAVDAKGCVERGVGIETQQCESAIATGGSGITAQYHLAIGREGQPRAAIVTPVEIVGGEALEQA